MRFASAGARAVRPACVLPASYIASVLRPSCVCGYPRAPAAASIAWLFGSDLRVDEAVGSTNIHFKASKLEGAHHKRDKMRQEVGSKDNRIKFCPEI